MSNLESVTAAEAPGVQPPTGPGGPLQTDKPRSLAGDAWRDLRRSWVFWTASVIVLVILTMAAFPTLYTSADPNACSLERQYAPASGGALFGYNFQGCDTYARTIYGARASIQIGVLSTLLSGVIAGIFGMTTGYFGGWVDAVLSRFIDIVLGIPFLLGAIVLGKRLASAPGSSGIAAVTVTLGVLTWTTGARIMRSSVIASKNQDYVAAARMLGAGPGRLIRSHILPNSVAPFVVVMTILLGVNIASEATLSFLGVGLKPGSISWGIAIAEASPLARSAAAPLVWPSLFLALTVLAFIMLGDAIRDAFDPKLR